MALVAGHGPFTWGYDAMNSVENAVILENVKNLFLTLLQISVLVVECVLVNVLQTVLQVKRKCVT